MEEINEIKSANDVIEIMKDTLTLQSHMNPEFYSDCAFHLSYYLLDEDAKLAVLERRIAEQKIAIISAQTKRNVSEAEVMVTSSPLFTEYKMQLSTVERIKRMVDIAKLKAKIYGTL